MEIVLLWVVSYLTKEASSGSTLIAVGYRVGVGLYGNIAFP